MTIRKGSLILSVICLKIISSLLKAIFKNSGIIQRCFNKMFQRSNHYSKNPHLSSRKLAEDFGCGRTGIQTLIKQKEVMLTDWKCHENPFLKKKGRSEEFQDVNIGLCCVTRETLMPVSGPMIQKETLQIALKLNVTSFVWMEDIEK